MTLTAKQAYRILQWQKVYDNELGTFDNDKEIIILLIEYIKDCHLPFEDNDYTYHQMYEHLKKSL